MDYKEWCREDNGFHDRQQMALSIETNTAENFEFLSTDY
jgi:hypothetical protein